MKVFRSLTQFHARLSLSLSTNTHTHTHGSVMQMQAHNRREGCTWCPIRMSGSYSVQLFFFLISLSPTYTLTHSLARTHTRSLTHIHTPTHAHKRKCTHKHKTPPCSFSVLLSSRRIHPPNLVKSHFLSLPQHASI